MANREVVIFVSIIALVFALVATVFLYQISPIVIIALAIIIIGVSFASPRLIEFKEFERGVVFRFGKFGKVAGPGWVLFWPAFESFVPVDLRVNTVDLLKQPVITRDDVEVKLDAIIYVKVVDRK